MIKKEYLEEHIINRNNLNKLPDIVLIPWHFDNKTTPIYPYYGKREIFCGHNLQNSDSKERKFIHTNSRFFDIDEVLSQLDEKDQKIDLIMAIVEVNVTCFPKNLSKIKCPKIAMIADTHHLMYPISSLYQYFKRENFEHIFMYAQPAHLHFFYERGFKNCAFFPRCPMNFQFVNNKKSGITYIGKRWTSSHPRRSRMVQFLEKELPKKKIPFHRYKRLPLTLWYKVLTRSQIVVISSLNSQFTPQLYSILCAGALCFVDELSSQTFLYHFFKPGKHLIIWRNFKDLLKKLVYYYYHPFEAESIAKAGKLQTQKYFTISESRGLTISDFVFRNKIDPRFLAINDRRCSQKRVETPEYFNARIRLYENIQEQHRIHESLKLVSLTEKYFKILADLADLPRLEITHYFRSNQLKSEADLYFNNVGVKNQIHTILLKKNKKLGYFDIGILDTSLTNMKFKVKMISQFLKSNSSLWILGNLSKLDHKILKKEGFKKYKFKKNSITFKIKSFSKKICMLFWKNGFYPFPYLTIKPSMETVKNLNIFLRGWQANFPFLY